MGLCLSSCVNCATYLHDAYTDWRWDKDDSTQDMITISAPPVKISPLSYSIHTAVINRSITNIQKICSENEEAKAEQDSAGETALHLACKLGYVNIVEELLAQGCPANVCTDIGTPMHCVLEAEKKKYILSPMVSTRLLRLLAAHGCDVNAGSRGNKVPLLLSAENGNYASMKTLLSLGAEVNISEANQFTPLYMSAVKGDMNCLALLIAQKPKVNLNHKDLAGRSSLISALITILNNLRYERLHNDVYDMDEVSQDEIILNRFNRMAVIEALLRAGADPNLVDNYGRSPLDIAFTILEVDNIRVTVKSDFYNYQVGMNFSTLVSNCIESIETVNNTSRMHIPESVYTPLVRLLVLAGANICKVSVKDNSNSPEWMKQLVTESREAWTHGLPQKPGKLVAICRETIRAHLGMVHRLSLVHTLPLPQKLREYVCVRYI